MTTREIEEASAEDEEFTELRNCIMRGTWRNDQLKQYIPVASELCVIGKLILRGTRIIYCNTQQVEIPSPYASTRRASWYC